MAGHNYTSVQKLSLAGVVVGAILCIVGAVSPYWIVSDPQNFGLEVDLLAKVVKGKMGLFAYCVEVKLVGTDCEVIDMDNENGWFHVARSCAAGCVLLALISSMVSCCLACCNCCKRFICLGLLSFIAAGAGVACAAIFAKNTDVYTATYAGFKFTSYGWAFYTFCGGVALLGVVSLMACFAAPDNPVRGVIISHAPSVMVSMEHRQTHTNPYVHLQEDHIEVNRVGVITPPPIQGGPTVVTTNGY